MSEVLGLRPRLLLGLGFILVIPATVWWYVVFGNIVAEGYGSYEQASLCIWGTNYTCRLMLSLCTLDYWLIPKNYRPELFQAGTALILAGAGLALFARHRRGRA